MKTREITGQILFEEQQHFPKWLAILMVTPIIITVVVIFLPGALENGYRDLWFILFLIIPMQLLLMYFFSTAKLEKVVTDNGMYYRWTPLQKKYRYIDKAEIEHLELRKSPTLKYGSSYFPGYGRIHNLSNGQGIQISLFGGKKIFFGTADETFFLRALQKSMEHAMGVRHHA